MKKTLRAVFLVFLLLACLSTRTWASEPEESVSAAVFFQVEDTMVPGAAFRWYQVGTVGADGSLTLTGDFAGYPVAAGVLDSGSSRTVAMTLAGYIIADGIAPKERQVTDSNGVALLGGGNDAAPGVYLLLGDPAVVDGVTYWPEPTLMILPGYIDGRTEYHVTVFPKCQQAQQGSSLTVVKTWDDAGFEDSRPEKIQVALIDGKNETILETVTLSRENNWRHTWTDLPGEGVWYAVERSGEDGYTVCVAREGDTLAITNTCVKTKPQEPDTPSLPLTGTTWHLVPVLAAAGLLLLLAGWLWRKRNESR